MLALLFALTAAQAADGTGLWAKTSVGVAGWPAGAISDTRIQYRAPGPRSESIVFQDTYFGAGGKVALSPAFIEAGPRVSIAPIDVFDLDLQASWIGYFANGLGLMPYDQVGGKLDDQRDVRAKNDEGVGANALVLSATPTVKLKLGPIVAFDSWDVSYIRFDTTAEEMGAPMTYEPYRDLLVAWEDVAIAHQAAVLYTLLPGDDAAKLWIGGTLRDRMSLQAGDRSTATGAVVIYRPGTKPSVPQLVGQGLFYLNDADRVGRLPNLQMQASWTFE